MTRLLALLALVLVLAAGPAQAVGTDLKAALAAKTPFVLVVASTAAADTGSDAYADWQSYYRSFTASTMLARVEVTPKRYSAVLSLPKLAGHFAVLFVRDMAHALFVNDTVLEPAIYRLGSAYLANGEVPAEAASYGMSEVALKLR